MRDAALITALSQLVDRHPSWGLWQCCTWLRNYQTNWNYQRIDRVYKAMTLHLKRPAKRPLPKRERIALSVPKRPPQSRLVGRFHERRASRWSALSDLQCP